MKTNPHCSLASQAHALHQAVPGQCLLSHKQTYIPGNDWSKFFDCLETTQPARTVVNAGEDMLVCPLPNPRNSSQLILVQHNAHRLQVYSTTIIDTGVNRRRTRTFLNHAAAPAFQQSVCCCPSLCCPCWQLIAQNEGKDEGFSLGLSLVPDRFCGRCDGGRVS